MNTNVNPDTGIRFTVFALNKLNADLGHDLFYGTQAKDLSYEQALTQLREELESEADAIEDEVHIGIAETDPSLVEDERYIEQKVEDAYLRIGYDGRDDYIDTLLERRAEQIQIEEPTIAGTLDGVRYEISWLGGAPLLWVIESPYLGKFRTCSPCCPNACDGDSPDEGGVEGYDIPEEWKELK